MARGIDISLRTWLVLVAICVVWSTWMAALALRCDWRRLEISALDEVERRIGREFSFPQGTQLIGAEWRSSMGGGLLRAAVTVPRAELEQVTSAHDMRPGDDEARREFEETTSYPPVPSWWRPDEPQEFTMGRRVLQTGLILVSLDNPATSEVLIYRVH